MYIVPSWRRKGKIFNKLTSANFSLGDLQRQFFEEGVSEEPRRRLVVTSIHIPYFTRLSHNDVLRVRSQDGLYYEHFEKELFNRLNRADISGIENALLEDLKFIGDGLKKLEKLYQPMLKACEQGKLDAVIHFARVEIGLVMLMPEEIRLELIREVSKWTDGGDREKLLHSLSTPIDTTEQEELYLLWRVSHKPKRKRLAKPIAYEHIRGDVRLRIEEGLVERWHALATYFEIPLPERKAFTSQGREPAAVLDWLEARQKLNMSELRKAFDRIGGCGDLINILDEGQQRSPALNP